MRGKSTQVYETSLYPNYVYAHMKMSPAIYTAIINTKRVVNFVGYDEGQKNRKGQTTAKKGATVPVPLEADEIEVLMENIKKFSVDPNCVKEVVQMELGTMVEIQNNGDIFDKQIGAVRAVKDNTIIVRVSNFGPPVEVPCLPEHIRRLSDEEIIEDNMQREAKREGRHVNEIKRKYGLDVPFADDEALILDRPKRVIQSDS